MGFSNMIRNQFLDVIEFVDETGVILIKKFDKPGNEIKQGSSVVVREGQSCVFVSQGQLADIFPPGTYTLNTKNMPVLTTLKAFGSLFRSPVKADIYFVSRRTFIDQKWATKNPIMMRDPEFNMIRIRGFGKFSFQISDVQLFFSKICGAQHLYLTYDIIQYLSSFISETIAIGVSKSGLSAIDLAIHYRELSDMMRDLANERARDIGVTFESVVVENLSLPDEVEKLIDEQSGIGMAKKDMATFLQYQTARAMREAASQEGGLAGLGASAVLGKEMASSLRSTSKSTQPEEIDRFVVLREYKKLLEEGIISQEDFDKKKKELLKL